MQYLSSKREGFRVNNAFIEGNSLFKPTNYTISVSGNVQKYNTTRRKIEIKREIRDRFSILKENSNNVLYLMEHHADLHELLERILQIKHETGELPLLMHFRKEKTKEINLL